MRIIFNSKYLTETMKPKPGFPPWEGSDDAAQALVNSYLEDHWHEGTRSGQNYPLTHPYFIPGAHYNHLWDWDAYFMSRAAWDKNMYSYAEGSLRNFLESTNPEGRPAKLIRDDGSFDYQHPIPLLAQWTCLVCTKTNDWNIAREFWDTLVAVQRWHENFSRHSTGLFIWESLRGSGFDNHPALYGRPERTVAGTDLNSFHYLEYRSLEIISAQIGVDNPFTGEAESLQLAISETLFDPVDTFFYHVDVAGDQNLTTNQLLNWWPHMKYRHIAGIMPLWAGVADPDLAEQIIRKHIIDTEGFLSPYGIRSMSKKEPLYNNVPMANPSNWQGPVWILSTVMTVETLKKYGFSNESQEVARRLIRHLAGDILHNNTIHEFYHGETGIPLLSPGFLSWNIMAHSLIR